MKTNTPRLVIVLLLLATTALSGCKPEYSATFEKTECQFEVPPDEGIECGYLIVPEVRTRNNGPNVRIHVAIVRSQAPQPAPDPLVILTGGPGGHALDSIQSMLKRHKSMNLERDLIIFDQRGTGYSEPSLNCPEAEEQRYQDWGRNINVTEENQNYIQAMQACHDRMITEGINPAAYTSAANAADVEDLRKALGYSKWNLYGISYGTRLALTVIRDYPEGVRSMILDSVYPPQVDLYTTQTLNFERSLNLLFDGCALDPKCSEDFPDLKSTFYGLVDQLDAHPLELHIFHPLSGKAYNAVVNGSRFIMATFSMLYSTEQIPSLPRHITNIKENRIFTFSWFLRDMVFADDYWSEGMYFSVQCSEEVSFGFENELQRVNPAVHPRLSHAVRQAELIYNLCPTWSIAKRSSIENKAVRSDIPTLILAGEFDPITPPAWGRLAGETLKNSQYLEFPGFGHGVLGNGPRDGECSKQIINSFLTDPKTTVDASCINSIEPPFKP